MLHGICLYTINNNKTVYIVLPVAGMSERCFEIMAYTRKNDEAVSPVIGVILMVAITVILAAVIAAFVFGMSGNITKTKTVAVTVQKVDSSNITVMNMGGQDGGALTGMNVTTTPNLAGCTVGTTTTTGTSCSTTGNPVSVGTNMRLTSAGLWTGRTQVIAVGTFNDGSQQVLLDTFV
jgi:flagellin-like protein